MATAKSQPPVANNASAASPDEPISVLFIEDDPAVAEMYRIKLEVDGYQVTVTDAGGLDGSLLRRRHPEIVFLDIRAPHRERVQLLRTLHGEPASERAPVVILSDYSTKELDDMGVGLHRQEYLVVSVKQPGDAPAH